MDKKVVYVSFSKKDVNKVDKLTEELKTGNFEVWRSEHSKNPDVTILDKASVFIVCLSVHYCTDDECHSEFLMMHWQEKLLVPVVLDTVSWPPGDNLFIHRDFFWNLTYLMLDVSDKMGSDGQLLARLNTALGITDADENKTFGTASPKRSAPSPAALSSAEQKTKDEDIMMKLARQSEKYQKMTSAPPSVSGRDRSQAGLNSIERSSDVRFEKSRREQSASRYSRRSSLLTVTTTDETNESRPDKSVTEFTNNPCKPEKEVIKSEDSEQRLDLREDKQSLENGDSNVEKQNVNRINLSQVQNKSTIRGEIQKNHSKVHEDTSSESSSQRLHRRPSGGDKKSKTCSLL